MNFCTPCIGLVYVLLILFWVVFQELEGQKQEMLLVVNLHCSSKQKIPGIIASV